MSSQPLNSNHSIQYREMTVDDWNSIPPSDGDYSNYWASPDSFQPETFSENTQKETHFNDLGWLIAFWIQFAAMAAICVWLITLPKTGFNDNSNGSNSTDINSTNTTQDSATTPTDISLLSSEEAVLLEDNSFTANDLLYCLGIGFGIAIVLNVLHFFYATCAPVVYVKVGLVFVLILSIASALWLALSFKFYLFLIYPAIYIIVVICWYCIRRKYIKLTAAIMKVAIKIIFRYPGSIILTFLYGIVAGFVAIFYSYLCYAIAATEVTPWLYLPVILSFLWTSQLLYYVLYLTIAGVAASWYFLNDTSYMPSSPCLSSLGRALTTSFGSAAEGAFILALIEFCYLICSIRIDSGNDVLNLIIVCLQCCLGCILRLLYRIFGIINRYALIYCATFGIGYIPAIKRFTELNTSKMIDVLLSGSVLSDVLTISNIGFTVMGALLGFGIGYLWNKDVIDYRIWLCIFALILTFCIFEIFQAPIQVTGDTLLICFAECPQNLQTTAAELAEELKGAYSKGLHEKCQSQ